MIKIFVYYLAAMNTLKKSSPKHERLATLILTLSKFLLFLECCCQSTLRSATSRFPSPRKQASSFKAGLIKYNAYSTLLLASKTFSVFSKQV